MGKGTYRESMAVDGTTISLPKREETADHPNNYVISLPAGNAGTLSTRTSDTEGVVTLLSGHGISTSDTFDLYWVGGARYAITCDSATATTVTFDNSPAATGDVLPAEDFAIIATERVEVATHIDGDEVKMFGISADQRAQCTFYDTGDAIIKQYTLEDSNYMEKYIDSSNETNPLTGNPITYAMMSNGGIVAATLTVLCLEEAT